MNRPATPIVLVGYPKGLGDYDLFSSKARSLMSALDQYRVIAIDDHRGFCETYFGDRLARTELGGVTLTDQESIVKECSHALFFWDGCELNSYIHLSMMHKLRVRVVPIRPARVVNIERGEEFDVYIGRRGPWGNPFAIGKDGSREEVIAKYRDRFHEKLLQEEPTKTAVLALRGLRLGCHCKPYACHGDVIAEYLNTLPVGVEPGEEPETRLIADRLLADEARSSSG